MQTMPMTAYGLHLLFDGYGAPKDILEDVGYLYQALMKLPDAIGMQRIAFPHLIKITKSPITGLSGFVFIMESHISVHTYSERGFVTVDVYSCKEFDVEATTALLAEVFKVERYESQVVIRGKEFALLPGGNAP